METPMLSESKCCEPSKPTKFGLSSDERNQMYWGRNPDMVAPTRQVIINRDGVTIELWDASFVRATVLVAREGALGTINAEYDSNLMGDGLPRCYLLWQALTGGKGSFCYISDLWVAREFRRKGLGSWMLKQILSGSPFQRIYLASNSHGAMSNYELYTFYEKHGFRRVDSDVSLMEYVRGNEPKIKPTGLAEVACQLDSVINAKKQDSVGMACRAP